MVDRNLAIKRTGNTTLRVQAPFVGVTKIGVVGRIAVLCSSTPPLLEKWSSQRSRP